MALLPQKDGSEPLSGFLNKMTGIGALAGVLLGTSIFPGSLLTILGLGTAGGCVGHVTGSVKANQKIEEGEELKQPSFWNKDALLGGLIGLVSARVITLGVVNVLSGMATASTVAFLATPAAMAVIATAVTASMVIGLYLGGRYGKKCLETEYETKTRERMSKMLDSPLAQPLLEQILGTGLDNVTAPEREFVKDYLEQKQMQQGAQPALPR